MLHKLSNLKGIKTLSRLDQKLVSGGKGPLIPCLTCARDSDCCDAAAECVRGACRIWH